VCSNRERRQVGRGYQKWVECGSPTHVGCTHILPTFSVGKWPNNGRHDLSSPHLPQLNVYYCGALAEHSTRREDSVSQIERVTTQGKSPSATSLPQVPQQASHSSSPEAPAAAFCGRGVTKRLGPGTESPLVVKGHAWSAASSSRTPPPLDRFNTSRSRSVAGNGRAGDRSW